MRPSTNPLRVLGVAGALAMILGGCSQYLARRDAISLNAGNALAADQVTEVVDPWPRYSANNNIAFNGERMQGAIERYRTHQVISPTGTGTSGAYAQAASGNAGAAPANNTKPLGPTINSQASAN